MATNKRSKSERRKEDSEVSYPLTFLQGAIQGLVQNIYRKLYAGEEEGKKKNKPLFHLLVKHSIISITDQS